MVTLTIAVAIEVGMPTTAAMWTHEVTTDAAVVVTMVAITAMTMIAALVLALLQSPAARHHRGHSANTVP